MSRALTEVSGGQGFDLVAECAGVPGVFDTCVDLVRVGGTVYAFGWHTQPETIHPYTWHTKHFRLLSNAWTAALPFDVERFKRMCEVALLWLSKGLWRVAPLVGEITPREELMAAVERLHTRPGEGIKVVIA